MTDPGAAAGGRARRMIRPLASFLRGAGLALLACCVVQPAVARELSAPAAVTTPGQPVAEPGTHQRPVAGSLPAPVVSAASPPAANTTDATEAADGVSAGMPVWKLLVIDARSVFTAPAHWTGGEG